MSIRKATPDQSGLVRQIVEASVRGSYSGVYCEEAVDMFLEHHSLENILEGLEKDLVLLSYEGEEPVGVGCLRGEEIRQIYILPAFQGRGHGTRLLLALEAAAIKAGQRQVYLDASIPGKPLYKKHGYREVSHEQVIGKQGGILDYWRMEKQLSAEGETAKEEERMTKITSRVFGQTRDGQEVKAFTLSNGQIQTEILEYGCTVQSLFVRDKEGEEVNVVLSLGSVEDYEKQNVYLGCVVGRYGNRVRDGRFTLDGITYQLTQNDGSNHLHGGKEGFNRKVWQGQIDGETLRLRYISPGGEEGYPGRLSAIVSYSLEGNALRIEYEAMTDRPTIVNLTNHSFFHLAGGRGGDVCGHQVQVNANRFLQIDDTGMPDGTFVDVAGTVLDLRRKTCVGDVLSQKDRLLDIVGGIDHCYSFENAAEEEKAWLYSPLSGITMKVYSDCEGMQVYSGNFLTGADVDRYGKELVSRSGICFEPQRYPDSINQPAFPDPILRPGETYHQFTLYQFGIAE